MKKLSQEKDDLLIRYLDGDLSAGEKEVVERDLLSAEPGRQRLEYLQSIHTYLKKRARLEMPSKNFTEKVLDGLTTVQFRSSLSYKRGLLLLLGTLLASGIALALLSAGVFDAPTTPLLVDAPIDSELFKVPTISIPFNGKLIVNGIIFLNLGLAFVLFDRTVLRPWFQKRTSMGY